MDEQPESGRMKVMLRPTAMQAAERRRWASDGDDAVIGFCGFPKKTTDAAGVEESYHIIDEDEEAGLRSHEDDEEDGITERLVSEMSLAEAKAHLIEAHSLIDMLRDQLRSQHREVSNGSIGDESLGAQNFYGS